MDRSFVLASTTMDRHLTYVAMTRHREAVELYVDESEFCDWGPHRRGCSEAAYAALEARLTRSGRRRRCWTTHQRLRRGAAWRSGLVSAADRPRGGAGPEDRGAGQAVPPGSDHRAAGRAGLAISRAADAVASAARAGTHQPEAPRSPRFAGLRLRAAPSVARPPEPERLEPVQEPVADPLADRLRSRSGLERALERYLQVHDARERQARRGCRGWRASARRWRRPGSGSTRPRPGHRRP